jgi:SAM-dependent methyltransferase
VKPDAGAPSRDHYSYAVYADPGMAERFDAMRFSGPIGQIVAATQERQILDALPQPASLSVLDVGTGTGRAALALARRGAKVTGVDASNEMLAVARRRAADAQLEITFDRADVQHLAFADRQFDAVVCLRVLMHVPDWRKALAELCRVSRQTLVFDYPALWSSAALHAAARRAAHLFSPSAEAYRVFSGGAIARALAAEGYRVRETHPLFVLPIALHKKVNSARWTTGVERALAAAGLRRLVGSPVTVVAERCGS